MASVKKKYFKANVMAFGKDMAGKMLPNLPFTAGKESEEFYSIKNTIPKASTGKISSILSDKIASAVMSSQICDDDTIIGWGRKGKYEFVIGQFSGGIKNDIETFIIIPEKKQIISTNIYSKLFYKTVIAWDLLNFIKKADTAEDVDREIFVYLEKLKQLPTEKYDSSSGMLLDSSDAEVFYTLCDSILFTAKTLDGFQISDVEPDDCIISDYLLAIQYNLLPLVAMHNKSFDMTLDIGGTDIVPEITAPKVKRKKKGMKASVTNAFVPYPDRDYTLMDDKEANQLPDDLKRTRQIAIDLFNRNKDFLTEEQWESIVSFKNGRITKLGLYGDSATGKTTFVKMLAGALKLPFMIVTGNGDTEAAHLFGHMTVKNGTTEFCEGALPKIMRYGGIFFFDERNMVNAGVVAATNNILDDTRMYTIPQTGETIIAHPLFRYCEAFNVGYEGTKDDNISHISRIDEWHKMSGYSDKTEADILTKETGIDNALALKMIQIKNNISNKITEDGDETTQRVDLRSCLAWANKTMDLEGNAIRAALSTIMTPLAKEVADVTNSSDIKSFETSEDEVISYAIHEISSGFNPPKQKLPQKDYQFEAYELK